MIALVRIDNRLLHGQILEAWAPRLKISRVVVADDDAAASPLAKAAMTLCLPRNLPADVLPIGKVDYAALAKASERVLILFRDVADLERAVGAGLTSALAPRVNLGNVHYAVGRRAVTPSVFLSRAEVSAVQALAAAGFDVEARAVPTDVPAGPGELARKYDAEREKG